MDGQQERVARVVRTDLERVDAPLDSELLLAGVQVRLDSGRALIAVLGRLGHQLGDDRRQHGRQVGLDVCGRRRDLGDMRVDHRHGVISAERQPTGEQFVHRHAQ